MVNWSGKISSELSEFIKDNSKEYLIFKKISFLKIFYFEVAWSDEACKTDSSVERELRQEIEAYDGRLKEKDEVIEKLRQTVDLNFHILHAVGGMNRMLEARMREEPGEERTSGLPQFSESLEPETMQEFEQVILVIRVQSWLNLTRLFAAAGRAETQGKHR